MFTPVQLNEASSLLATYLQPTRLVVANSLSSGPTRVFLKLESEQPTGSFKVRGALYALQQRIKDSAVEEVVASSTGNHGAAVAYAARQLHVRATIFLPENPNPVKVDRIRRLGAAIDEGGRTLAEAVDRAIRYAAEHRACLLQDATDPDIPIGAATIAAELLTQLNRVDEIVVPVGDTALIRGIGGAFSAAGQPARVIGVQAEKAPAYFRSWHSGRVETTDSADTIADGLATTRPEAANVDAIRALVHDVVLVSDAEMLDAIRWLAENERVIAEPAGAASTAAFRKLAPEGAKNIVLVVSGRNVSPEVLQHAGAAAVDLAAC